MLITNLAGRRRLHRRTPGAVTRNYNPDHSKDSRPRSVQQSDQHARSYCIRLARFSYVPVAKDEYSQHVRYVLP